MKRKEYKPEMQNGVCDSFDIVIPQEVFFDPNLTNTEKLLFGLLQNLAQGKDGCWASNSYLGNLLGVGNDVISRGIANLKKNKFIKVYRNNTVFKTNRRIFINYELFETNNYSTLEGKNQLKDNNNSFDKNDNESKNNYTNNQNIINNDDNQYRESMITLSKNTKDPTQKYYPPLVKILTPISKNTKDPTQKYYGPLEKILTNNNIFKNKYIFKNTKKNKNNMPETKTDEKSNTPQSKKTNNLTWSQLIEKYGRSQVKFVRYFLKKQKENFPKFIKDDISPNNSRVLTSLDCLDKLQRIDGFDFETEIKPTLEAALQDEFWARNILSLGSLRNKGRNGEKKFINIMVTLSNKTKTSPFQSHKQSITPDDIIAEQGWDDFRIKLLKKSVFDPVFSKLNGASDKTEITKSICKLIREIEKRQKRPKPPENEKDYQMRKFIFDKWELIPQANRILKDFVKWLDNQDWIGELKPGHFDIDGRTFAMFRNYYQDSIGGFDIFEGRML